MLALKFTKSNARYIFKASSEDNVSVCCSDSVSGVAMVLLYLVSFEQEERGSLRVEQDGVPVGGTTTPAAFP